MGDLLSIDGLDTGIDIRFFAKTMHLLLFAMSAKNVAITKLQWEVGEKKRIPPHPSETSLTSDRGARFRCFTCIQLGWDFYRIFCLVRETVRVRDLF